MHPTWHCSPTQAINGSSYKASVTLKHVGGIRCHLKQVSCIPLELFPSFFLSANGWHETYFNTFDATHTFQCNQGLRVQFEVLNFWLKVQNSKFWILTKDRFKLMRKNGMGYLKRFSMTSWFSALASNPQWD